MFLRQLIKFSSIKHIVYLSLGLYINIVILTSKIQDCVYTNHYWHLYFSNHLNFFGTRSITFNTLCVTNYCDRAIKK